MKEMVNLSSSFIRFPRALTYGYILSRPNRFLMEVKPTDEPLQLVHCPCPGTIASLNFNRIGCNAVPCLLSPNISSKNRKTNWSVEAISLDDPNFVNISDMKWIGINQVRANRYVESLILQGSLNEVTGVVDDEKRVLKREQTLFSSKIDFCIGRDHFIEVKSPLSWVESSKHERYDKKKKSALPSVDRVMKHHEDMTRYLRENPAGKCSVILVFMFENARVFNPNSERDENEQEDSKPLMLRRLIKSIQQAKDIGVETWQLNLRVNREGFDILNFFQILREM